MTSTAQQNDYWVDYFEKLYQNSNSWIDYGNERLQLQTFGATVEAIGTLHDRRVLDIGCGRGQLCRMAKLLGARDVVGVDMADNALKALRHVAPDIDWRAGDITSADFQKALGRFDAIVLLEVMQYLPVSKVISDLWSMLNPGGRIIAIYPNEDCPIVQRTVKRFDERYQPPRHNDVISSINSLEELELWSARGLAFADDQRALPYRLTSWDQCLPLHPVANRVQLLLQKKATRGHQTD